MPNQPKAALEGIRVIEAATLFAGPLAGTYLADFGAEVIKIEHPNGGDPVRVHGPTKNGVPLWWKMAGRNKRSITLYLGTPEGQDIVRKLVQTADVLIENFRPGTLERWNLAPDLLHELNPKLIIARVSGFGQDGPYRTRPAFGTLAEAMSGFAAMTGEPDGPPTLPPLGLADNIAAMATTMAISFALHARHSTGRGQVIDLALIEPILTILGPQPTWFDQLGLVPPRLGNRSMNNAPRNTYQTKDERWVAVSTSSQNIVERVMRLVGHPEVIEEPWFASGVERARHSDLLDSMVGGWIARHTLEEVMAAFEAAEAAIAPVYDIRHIMTDPQFQFRDTITTIPDEELGEVKMQNVMFRLSETPGHINWAGRKLGQDNDLVYREMLGLSEEYLARLKEKGVI